jgi:NAD(P)-dependent dehydrogenase (short-subunit alcohol dehydrogenase family)
MPEKIAAITGANRGLGWGTAQALAGKGYQVILLGRNLPALETKAKELPGAKAVGLDLAHPESIEKAAQEVRAIAPAGLDILVNNAGVFLEKNGTYSPEEVRATLQVNTLGPLQFSLALGDPLRRREGSVVNVSSGMGQLSEMNGGYPGYRISKTALNAVTRYLSAEWKESGVRVNSICPGWVRTEMGGPQAERSVEEGVASILYAALLPKGGPTGGFFRDGKRLEW